MQSRFRRILISVLPIGLAAFAARNLPSSTDVASANATDIPKVYLEPRLLTGTIYESGSGRKNLLFTFRRTATATNSLVQALREYHRPDGSAAARERVLYNENSLVSYEVEELQFGSKAKVIIRPDPKKPDGKRMFFEYTPKGGPTKEASEELQPDVLINDMVAPFILSHWQELIRGVPVRCRFMSVSRMQTVGLKLVKESEGTREGKKLVNVRMELTSLVMAPFLKPLLFTIEADGQHRILEYNGRTTPRVLKNGKWVELDASTVFDWK